MEHGIWSVPSSVGVCSESDYSCLRYEDHNIHTDATSEASVRQCGVLRLNPH